MRVTSLIVLASLTGCIPVTVNLTFAFPPKEMEQKLREMEKKVYEQEPEAPKNNAAAFDPVAEQDRQPDLTVETPAIKQINERRKKRADELVKHLGAGRCGEANDGRVAEREAGDLSGKDKAAFRRLLKEENEDRDTLLKEILKANKLQDDQMDNLRSIYAMARRKEARIGWWIQGPKGKWLKKTEEIAGKLEKDEPIDE